MYLFILLALPGLLVKARIRGGASLLVIPEPGEKTLIHSDWYARKANEVKMDGNRLSAVPLDKTGWLPARVPGTVLTTLLENGLYPAPEFGLNNNLIPVYMKSAMISIRIGLPVSLLSMLYQRGVMSG